MATSHGKYVREIRFVTWTKNTRNSQLVRYFMELEVFHIAKIKHHERRKKTNERTTADWLFSSTVCVVFFRMDWWQYGNTRMLQQSVHWQYKYFKLSYYDQKWYGNSVRLIMRTIVIFLLWWSCRGHYYFQAYCLSKMWNSPWIKWPTWKMQEDIMRRVQSLCAANAYYDGGFLVDVAVNNVTLLHTCLVKIAHAVQAGSRLA